MLAEHGKRMGSDINRVIDPEERLKICGTCPHFWKRKICKKCGCVMPLKVKIKKAKCPEGKW